MNLVDLLSQNYFMGTLFQKRIGLKEKMVWPYSSDMLSAGFVMACRGLLLQLKQTLAMIPDTMDYLWFYRDIGAFYNCYGV